MLSHETRLYLSFLLLLNMLYMLLRECRTNLNK
nr:MAG TPA_asm: hypothetical protein [Caudoviricetes sp.]